MCPTYQLTTSSQVPNLHPGGEGGQGVEAKEAEKEIARHREDHKVVWTRSLLPPLAIQIEVKVPRLDTKNPRYKNEEPWM